MSITTKKIQIIPVGDKEEVNRVYEYIRNGIYNQYRILNTYMSQMGTLYYAYDRDIKNAEYKEKVKEIFRNTNEAIKDIPQAKGLGMAGNCGMRVKADFSTAIKNGLAKGERQLPFYKRDFPLLCPSRFLIFSDKEETVVNEETGKERIVTNYYIKFVNGINFKVITGKGAKRDFYLMSLLENIVHDPDHYKVCGSTMQFSKKKIILNLTVNVQKETVGYVPVKGRKMAIVLGYDQPLVAALSDTDKEYSIGHDCTESIVIRRQSIQAHRTKMQASLKYAKGGHGRGRKLRRLDQQEHYEKNVVRNFNHILSSKVVSFAADNKVEAIVIDDIKKDDLTELPIVLRNWSYYQLETYIVQKAKVLGIDVVLASPEEQVKCCFCGEEIKSLPVKSLDKASISEEKTFVCPHCKKEVGYRYNKAKVLAEGNFAVRK